MTRAPEHLSSARRLLLDHLDIAPAALGIVGDANHRGGYHCGRDRLDPARDYSVVESTRDRAGLDEDASALDVGMFSHGPHNLRTFSVWCVMQCKMDREDARDIREIIYSPDGKVVKRWDRLRKRTTGDSSHLSHTHFSVFRDAKVGLSPLFTRYLSTIGLIKAPEDDVTKDEAIEAARIALWGLLQEAKSGSTQTGRDVRDALQAVMAPVVIDPVELRAELERVQVGEVSADAFVDSLVKRLAN